VLGFDFEFEIIVVDNDPLGTAHAAVVQNGSACIRYAIEPAPGVTNARNRVLMEAADCDALAFIDDDEVPQSGWLGALISAALAYDADAVSGPVHSVFEGPLDPWVEASETYDRTHRSHLSTGDPISRAATNNLLLDMRQVRALGVTFDQRFGLTGGEDSFFSGQLRQRGARMIWAADAVVDDLVPMTRANRRYNLQRRFSLSNAGGRVDILLAAPGVARTLARLRGGAKGIAQVAKGSTMAIRGRLGGELRLQSQGERYVVGGFGVLAAALGIAASPYRRKAK
jgi:glycosyltransferase involved in cell wall biosynthesis